MKLALIRRQFSPTGRAELYLQRLMEALTRKGHELHLFAEGRLKLRQHAQTESTVRSNVLMAGKGFSELAQIGSFQCKERTFLRLLALPEKVRSESRAQSISCCKSRTQM